MKQGIVTILNPDGERSKASSIRRTLSAEVLVGLSSSAIDSSSSSSSDGEEEEFEKIPRERHVRMNGGRNIGVRTPARLNDDWGSILRCRRSDGSGLPPPYVHPLIKRSGGGLSERSLEVCTESLGSETGSDCFSSSEWLSDGKELGYGIGRGDGRKAANRLGKLNAARYRKSPDRPIPPPIRSIAGGDGASLRVRSRRENGRLILEAVSVPPKRHFNVHRGNGRLVLTLISPPSEEGVPAAVGSGEGVRLGLVMKKLMAIGNRNPQFSAKLAEEEFALPRLPRMIQSPPAAAPSFNAYNYFWRNKAGISGGSIAAGNKNPYENREMIMMKAGCKETRRSVSIWKPYCIATS